MFSLIAIPSLCIFWYLLRFLAHFSKTIKCFVSWASVYTRFLHRWILSAPATFTYIAIFSAFTLIQLTTSSQLIATLTNKNSTSIARLSKHPIAVLFDSAFWVADRGDGLVIYILLFASLVAWSERKYGTPRLIIIGLVGHILASLLTVSVELWAIHFGWATNQLNNTTDVGVSYILVAACAAAVLLMRHWLLLIACTMMAIFILGPLIVSHSIWDLGHLFASLVGLLTALILLKLSPPRNVNSLREEIHQIRRENASLS